MGIAICDNEINAANSIRFTLVDIEKIRIYIFESSVMFLDIIRNGRKYDLVFTDIYIGDEKYLILSEKCRKPLPIHRQ